MEYNNITVDERSKIIDGSIKIFIQQFDGKNYMSTACFHLNAGQTKDYIIEGIEIRNGNLDDIFEPPKNISIVILKKHEL